jgi:predicted transcriptional regulator
VSDKDQTLETHGTLISFRVDPVMASAMSAVARKELLTKSCVARRALAEDLRRRGALVERN